MSKNLTNYAKHTISIFTALANIDSPEKIKLKEPEKKILDEEKELFKTTTFIEQDQIIHNVRIGEFTNKIFAITNIDDIFSTDTIEKLEQLGLKKITPNGALFILITKHLNLTIRSNKLIPEIEENILHQHIDTNYQGHDWEELAKYIETFTIFQMETDNPLTELGLSCIGYIIYSHTHKSMKINSEALDQTYRDILQLNLPIPKENIFLSLTSPHWKHSFLEAYRCLEGIFQIPRAIELKTAINFECSALTLAKTCVKALNWKRKEEDSLVQLLTAIDLKNLNIDGLLKTNTFEKLDTGADLNRNIANKIYKIRNQLVHQIEDDIVAIPEQDWKDIVQFILECCKTLYTKYKNELTTECYLYEITSHQTIRKTIK